MAKPKLPEVELQLTGEDGNAFFIIARAKGAMTQAGHGDQFPDFSAEAMSGDYDHLLQTCMAWFSVN